MFSRYTIGVLLMLLLAFCLTTNTAAQEKITITELNAYLDRWEGRRVEVVGYLYINDVTKKIEVWETLQQLRVRHRFNWERHIELKPGDYLPEGAERYQESLVRVTGVVDKTNYNYPQAGDNLIIAYLEVTNFELKEKNIINPIPEEKDYGDIPQAACDSCKFAILFSGYREMEHWNDIKQKYDYKKTKHNVCPDHIVVLFKGGTRNAAIIPNGTTDASGNFTSGGAFDASPDNFKKAFEYIKKKMKALNCKPAEFQFHSTGHGGGYHKRRGQGTGVNPVGGADSLEDGIAGGRLDLDGDEEFNKTHEDSVIFRYRGKKDLDGDGRPDIEVRMVPDPRNPAKNIRQVRFDSDGNGSFDKVIGYDFNGDGRVSNADSGWVAPDLNRNGKKDYVGWDDVMNIDGGKVITDDLLKKLMKELIDSTGLDKAHSRAELSQCFSGSFLDDLRGVTAIATSAARRDEYAHGPVGLTGYNRYQKHFFDSLMTGNSWEDAHRMAADSTKKEMKEKDIVQTPQISDNTKVCIVYKGPYKKGNKICIEIQNLCGKKIKVEPFIKTYNFGIKSPKLGEQRFGEVELNNYEKREFCINLPTETGKYCFLGGGSYFEGNTLNIDMEWLNNVKVEVPVGNTIQNVNFIVGGDEEFEEEFVFLVTDPTTLPPGWEMTLSQEAINIQNKEPVEVTATFSIPPDAPIGETAYFRIEGYTESEFDPFAGFIEGEIIITEPGEEYTAELQSGWNLISLKGIPQTPVLRDIFFDANALLGYMEPFGYTEMNEYALNAGFWASVPDNNKYGYFGQAIEEFSMPLEAGWSLLGGLSDVPAVPEVNGSAQMLGMFCFNPESGYEPCDVIQPGSAVWVNLSEPAEVIVQPATQIQKLEQAFKVWQLPIIAKGEESGFAVNKSSCVIGVSFDAEELVPAPPAPPENTTSISLARIDNSGKPLPQGYYMDIQQETEPGDTLRWYLRLDPNGMSDGMRPSEISWEPAMLDNGDNNQRWLIVTEIVTEGTGEKPIDMQKKNSLILIGQDTIYLTVIYFKETPNAVEDNEQIKDLLQISRIIPNPFNNNVEVNFSLLRSASVDIRIFDSFGREVFRVDNGVLSAGEHSWTWQGINVQQEEVAAGNYFVRITAKSGKSIATAVELIGKIK